MNAQKANQNLIWSKTDEVMRLFLSFLPEKTLENFLEGENSGRMPQRRENGPKIQKK
jgi:hypothetical protein